MTIGAAFTFILACLHWIPWIMPEIQAWPTIYVFIPMIIEVSLEICIFMVSLVMGIWKSKKV